MNDGYHDQNRLHIPPAWAAAVYDRAVQAAQPWLEMSDAALWALMFGPTLRRSWMVWSNGHCPACGRAVPMYTWEIDALRRPWKVRCPHCRDGARRRDRQPRHCNPPLWR